MTPQQALALLHEVVGRVPLIRADWQKTEEAFVVLHAAIEEPE